MDWSSASPGTQFTTTYSDGRQPVQSWQPIDPGSVASTFSRPQSRRAQDNLALAPDRGNEAGRMGGSPIGADPNAQGGPGWGRGTPAPGMTIGKALLNGLMAMTGPAAFLGSAMLTNSVTPNMVDGTRVLANALFGGGGRPGSAGPDPRAFGADAHGLGGRVVGGGYASGYGSDAGGGNNSGGSSGGGLKGGANGRGGAAAF